MWQCAMLPAFAKSFLPSSTLKMGAQNSSETQTTQPFADQCSSWEADWPWASQ